MNYFFSSDHPPHYITSNTEYTYLSLLYVSQFFSVSMPLEVHIYRGQRREIEGTKP